MLTLLNQELEPLDNGIHYTSGCEISGDQRLGQSDHKINGDEKVHVG
jgi:hypothetical protein